MSLEQNKEIARLWFQAFNEHNLEKLLELYDDEAEHYSPKLKLRVPESQGLIRRKPALRSWWQDAFERLPELRYEVKHLIADENSVFMEYLRILSDDQMMVAEVLEIKNGRIIASRVYHS
jgi:ketosteroid isomerase-like protein